jgi:hypothetical protein
MASAAHGGVPAGCDGLSRGIVPSGIPRMIVPNGVHNIPTEIKTSRLQLGCISVSFPAGTSQCYM